MWNVELHCHTYWSKDSLASPRALLAACRRRGIDRLAVTDHNSLGGAREAAALAPDLFIVGEEILTTEGELLGYFLTEEVPPHLSPQETIDRLRRQGAVISVSHPYDLARHGWREEILRPLLPQLDALEAFNARTYSAKPNAQAAALAAEHGLPGLAGSDAHAPFEIGRGLTQLEPFHDAESFRRSLAAARLVARRSPPWVHLVSRYAVLRKRLGWRRPH
ncbi:MAG TPA: PHP-associated domain-containing protein [Anaerolineales bacterium]|nr:PHP-associated domain-containing protein [Anaerolineales bacterium]